MCAACWRQVRDASTPFIEWRGHDGALDLLCAIGEYEGRLREIIHALKYEHRRSISRRLGGLMRECGSDLLRGADGVVPVPLHRSRERSRGFNQAEDLARHLGPPVARLLARVSNTRSQIELPRDQRQDNVRNAFSFRPSALGPIPQIVVLVDDVATTGATLGACALVLKNAGVKEVRALTAARVSSVRR